MYLKDDIIILLVGKSASGKSTICKELVKKGWIELKSYTTRPIRTNDPNDINTHTFISKEEFDKLENKCAYTFFDGYEYCSTKEQVDNSDIYVIDPDGITYFKEHYDGIRKPIVVYINCDDTVLKERILLRGDSGDKIKQRIANDNVKFDKAKIEYDYLLPTYTYINSATIMINTIRDRERRRLFERRLP